MSELVTQLKTQLNTLSSDERAELARYLLDSLANEDDYDATETWDAELRRRVEEIEKGTAIGRPAEKVLADLRERYP